MPGTVPHHTYANQCRLHDDQVVTAKFLRGSRGPMSFFQKAQREKKHHDSSGICFQRQSSSYETWVTPWRTVPGVFHGNRTANSMAPNFKCITLKQHVQVSTSEKLEWTFVLKDRYLIKNVMFTCLQRGGDAG